MTAAPAAAPATLTDRDQVAGEIVDAVMQRLGRCPRFRAVIERMTEDELMQIGTEIFGEVRAKLIAHRMPLYADLMPLMPVGFV